MLFAKSRSSSALQYWPNIPMRSPLFHYRWRPFSRKILTCKSSSPRSDSPVSIFFNIGTSGFIVIRVTDGSGRFSERSSEGLVHSGRPLTKGLAGLRLAVPERKYHLPRSLSAYRPDCRITQAPTGERDCQSVRTRDLLASLCAVGRQASALVRTAL
jgi:hypothetical protein